MVNILKRLFRRTSQATLSPLAAELLSADSAVRDRAVMATFRLSQEGDLNGLTVLEEAIYAKSGMPNCDLHKPTRAIRQEAIQQYREAPTLLLDLSRRGALLRDPKVSGELIAAFVTTERLHGISVLQLADRIESEGGTDQLIAFQLLFNHMHQWTILDQAGNLHNAAVSQEPRRTIRVPEKGEGQILSDEEIARIGSSRDAFRILEAIITSEHISSIRLCVALSLNDNFKCGEGLLVHSRSSSSGTITLAHEALGTGPVGSFFCNLCGFAPNLGTKYFRERLVAGDLYSHPEPGDPGYRGVEKAYEQIEELLAQRD